MSSDQLRADHVGALDVPTSQASRTYVEFPPPLRIDEMCTCLLDSVRVAAPEEAVAAVEGAWLRILARRYGGRRFEMVDRDRSRPKVTPAPGGKVNGLATPHHPNA